MHPSGMSNRRTATGASLGSQTDAGREAGFQSGRAPLRLEDRKAMQEPED